jgi:hypothetical protein
MTAHATITYEITTPESAEDGDVAEHGFWTPGGWEHVIEDATGSNAVTLAEARDGEYDLTIGTALRAALELGAVHEIERHPRGLSARSIDPAQDRSFFENGESRTYALHVKGVSAGTAARITRVLKGK